MEKPEGRKLKVARSGSVVVAGWCAILAVPLILLRVSQALMDGQLEAAIRASLADPATWLSTQGLDRLALMLVAPIALISLVSGLAILRQKRWAWVALMTFLVLALLLNLIRSYLQEPEYGLMLVYAVLALILNQPDVRKAFRIGRPDDEPVE